MGRPSYKLFVTRTALATGGVTQTDGVAASSTNTYYGNKMNPRENSLGFQLQTTGTLTGTFTLWWSDEENPSVSDDTDWVQDTSWSPTNPAGSTTKVKYSVTDVRARWARVKYVNASGTGDLLGEYVS